MLSSWNCCACHPGQGSVSASGAGAYVCDFTVRFFNRDADHSLRTTVE